MKEKYKETNKEKMKVRRRRGGEAIKGERGEESEGV